MSFSWERTAALSPEQPSDDEIQKYVELIDARGCYRHLWWEWTNLMLVGRDKFVGLFLRSIPLPRTFGEEHVSLPFYNANDWTPIEHRQSARLDDKLITGSSVTKTGYMPMRLLQPFVDIIDIRRRVDLLGGRIAKSEAEKWGDSFCARGKPMYQSLEGFVEWTRLMIVKERVLLKGVGLYGAVYSSLFNYEHSPIGFFKAFVEIWDSETNTCILQDREWIVTLQDLQKVAGLPIYGDWYDEYIPSDVELFGLEEPVQNSREVIHKSPQSLKEVFEAYQIICSEHRTQSVTYGAWINHFLALRRESRKNWADVRNPLGVEPILFEYMYNPGDWGECRSQGFKRETFLTAYFALWLSVIMLPLDIRNVRPETFVMANKLARGIRLSLAPPTLACIYSGLRELSTSSTPGHVRVCFPLHYLYGFFAYYIPSLYTSPAPQFLREHLPKIIITAGGFYDRMLARDAKRFFISTLKHDSYFVLWPSSSFSENLEHQFIDTDPLDASSTPLDCTMLEFLVSIRTGWLPYRCNSNHIIEAYYPHRVANQFGFSQDVPRMLFNREQISSDLDSLAEAWVLLLRRGTGSLFTVPCEGTAIKTTESFALTMFNVFKPYRSCMEGRLKSTTVSKLRGKSAVFDEHKVVASNQKASTKIPSVSNASRYNAFSVSPGNSAHSKRKRTPSLDDNISACGNKDMLRPSQFSSGHSNTSKTKRGIIGEEVVGETNPVVTSHGSSAETSSFETVYEAASGDSDPEKIPALKNLPVRRPKVAVAKIPASRANTASSRPTGDIPLIDVDIPVNDPSLANENPGGSLNPTNSPLHNATKQVATPVAPLVLGNSEAIESQSSVNIVGIEVGQDGSTKELSIMTQDARKRGECLVEVRPVSQFSSAIIPTTYVNPEVAMDKQLQVIGKSILSAFQSGLKGEVHLSAKAFARKVNAVVTSIASLGISVCDQIEEWKAMELLFHRRDEFHELLHSGSFREEAKKNFEAASSNHLAYVAKHSEQRKELDDMATYLGNLSDERAKCEGSIQKLEQALRIEMENKQKLDNSISVKRMEYNEKQITFSASTDRLQSL